MVLVSVITPIPFQLCGWELSASEQLKNTTEIYLEVAQNCLPTKS